MVNGLKVLWESWYFTVSFGIRIARREMTRFDKEILREIKDVREMWK